MGLRWGISARGSGVRTGWFGIYSVTAPTAQTFVPTSVPDSSPESPFSAGTGHVCYSTLLGRTGIGAGIPTSADGILASATPDIPSIQSHSISCHSLSKDKISPGTAQPSCFSLCFQGSEGLLFPLTHSLRLLFPS